MTTHQYLALLRGINVGGNNLIKMADLKTLFLDLGFAGVGTYIQSGNVWFSSPETDPDRLVDQIEAALSAKFGYRSRLISQAGQSYLAKVISQPIYQKITIRNWHTTAKLLAPMNAQIAI